MTTIISNGALKLAINNKGAELCSAIYRGTEYIWNADPKVWNRHAPVLFPIVGKLANDTCRILRATYQMKQHGFARDRDFVLVEQTERQARFSLKADAETLAVYPFHFQLDIIYRLHETEPSFEVVYEVSNCGEEEMLFSIGAHPGFVCPLKEGKRRSDYAIRFSEIETQAYRHLLDGGLFNGKQELVLENSDFLPLSDGIFDKDALVFKHLRSESVSLIDDEGNECVRMDFKGFPYLGIWSKNDESPFVCLEPWIGLADKVGFADEFAKREGVRHLPAGETFVAGYTIALG